jgi:hypothetical protein
MELDQPISRWSQAMRRGAIAILLVACVAAAELQAQPGPAPGQGSSGMRAKGVFDTSGPKVCAIEMKATTKVVYGSACKEYCHARSPSIGDFFRSCFGHGCSSGQCGTVRTYNVLMKKEVPGPEIPVCRVKDLSSLVPQAAAQNPQPIPIKPR